MIETTPTLGFSEAINAAASKIFQIKGRSRRSEFWWTHMIVYITTVTLTPFVGSILSMLTIPLKIRRLHDTGRSGWWWGVGALIKVCFFISILYDAAMLAMNGHDVTEYETIFMNTVVLKYILFLMGIAIYDIIFLILCCFDSETTENKYGPSPKYVEKDII